MTESCPVTFNRLAEVRIGSIGPAAPGVSIRLVDLHGHDVAAGETGEILVRSPASCVGYWNDPAATTCLFDDGWLRTGDLASCDEDGYYWFKGRLKQLIIRGGSNISPQEVKEALHQHPAVLEAGVIGAPDSVNGEIVVAFLSGFPQNRPVPLFSAVGLARAGISASPLLVERVHHIPDGEQ